MLDADLDDMEIDFGGFSALTLAKLNDLVSGVVTNKPSPNRSLCKMFDALKISSNGASPLDDIDVSWDDEIEFAKLIEQRDRSRNRNVPVPEPPTMPVAEVYITPEFEAGLPGPVPNGAHGQQRAGIPKNISARQAACRRLQF